MTPFTDEHARLIRAVRIAREMPGRSVKAAQDKLRAYVTGLLKNG
jgi:hypothetical protein